MLEYGTLLPNRFIVDGDASFDKKVSHLTKTESEAVVKPDGLVNNLGWEPVPMIVGHVGFYPPSLPTFTQLDNTCGY